MSNVFNLSEYRKKKSPPSEPVYINSVTGPSLTYAGTDFKPINFDWAQRWGSSMIGPSSLFTSGSLNIPAIIPQAELPPRMEYDENMSVNKRFYVDGYNAAITKMELILLKVRG